MWNVSVATSHLLCPFFLFLSGGKQQSPHRWREPESHQAHPVDEEACVSLFYPSSPSLCHHTHTLTAHRQNSVQRNPFFSPPSSLHVLLCEFMHDINICLFSVVCDSVWFHQSHWSYSGRMGVRNCPKEEATDRLSLLCVTKKCNQACCIAAQQSQEREVEQLSCLSVLLLLFLASPLFCVHLLYVWMWSQTHRLSPSYPRLFIFVAPPPFWRSLSCCCDWWRHIAVSLRRVFLNLVSSVIKFIVSWMIMRRCAYLIFLH